MTWGPVWRPHDSGAESEPVPWDSQAYENLKDLMNGIPEGERREAALNKIKRLDCANRTLASCDPAAEPPQEVLHWQKQFAQPSVGDAAFEKIDAKVIRDLVCQNDPNAIYILRRLSKGGRLLSWGREFVDFIMSKHCPVSTLLTDEDKVELLVPFR